MSRNTLILIVVLAVLAAAYAIVLQATGQPVQAEHFVEWAGGGIVTFAMIAWVFGRSD